jgi:hypothetical protein
MDQSPHLAPWRQWYGLQRWRRRAAHQLIREPLCAPCLALGRVELAQVADHNPPHKGDWNAFRLGPLQSLCFQCHKRKWADDIHGFNCDIGDDGFPIDARHPFNARAGASSTNVKALRSPPGRKLAFSGADEDDPQ